MASVKRWLVRIVGGLAALLAVAALVIFVGSSRYIDRTYPFREYPISVPADSVSVARGEHLARLSCYGCHGDSLQGRLFFEQPGIARLVAPNALERLTTYSDAQFAGFIRYGVHKDGTSTFVMPPRGFYHMSDADLGTLIAYLRKQPKAATPTLPTNSYGPLGRFGILAGQFKNALSEMDTTVARVGSDPAFATTRQGEYLARMICANCHGAALTGDPATPSPSIAGAAGYSPSEFVTLLHEAKPRGETKLTLMADVVKGELYHLTDQEVAAIHDYLVKLPQTGVAFR